MTKLIISTITKNLSSNEICITRAGTINIILNILLCSTKFIIGYSINSISVTADAMCNLADAFGGTVTVLSSILIIKFKNKNIEYYSSLMICIFIFFTSANIFKNSVEKIIVPEKIEYSVPFILILVFAICIKLWLVYFNTKIYKLTGCTNMKVMRQDCFNDSLNTFSTVLVILVYKQFHFVYFDSIIGIAIAFIILIFGIKSFVEIIKKIKLRKRNK